MAAMIQVTPVRPLAPELADLLANAPLAELVSSKAWLLDRGQRVGPAAVATAALQARQREASAPRWQAQMAQRRAFLAELEADLDRIGTEVARTVAEVVEATGAGPTWSELGWVMGWRQRWQFAGAIRWLVITGWLAAGPEARSLRPGPGPAKAGAAKARPVKVGSAQPRAPRPQGRTHQGASR